MIRIITEMKVNKQETWMAVALAIGEENPTAKIDLY